MAVQISLNRATFFAITAAILLCFWVAEPLCGEYQQAVGLIDLRTSFSDGAYNLESLVQLAKMKGFSVLIINDHDRMAMEYGLPPFRNIIKKRVELNSINKRGAGEYLKAFRQLEKKYPDMIIIPGSETTPFYYWTGSFFKKNLTAHNHERRILTVGLERAEDYQSLPIIHNGFSTKYTIKSLPSVLLFIVLLLSSVFLLKKTGIYRIVGIIIAIYSVLFIINTNPFRSSPFDQYHGDQRIAPYQLLIDYVNSRGGMTFWNYPETRSGVRSMGPIFVHTAPYPEVLEISKDYTGFAALYGDAITVTEPGNIWDKVLLEYCRGKRERPAWGIATADFHKEGEAGEDLGNFPTVFFVYNRTKSDILEAMKKGKMYACRGKYPHIPKLAEFSVFSTRDKITGISGDEIVLRGYPQIRISLSAMEPIKNRVAVRVIRSGVVIRTFVGKLPLELDIEDEYFKQGEKIYYRMDMCGYGTIVSNPIFVSFK